MKPKHPIDGLFEKGLKEHKIAASEQAWERIAAAQKGKPSRRFYGAQLLRAATITLLLGLSAVVYFNRNAEEIMNEGPGFEEPIAVDFKNKNKDEPKTNQADEPQQSKAKAQVEPQNAKAKKTKSKPDPKTRVVPVLQPTLSDPVLAMNDLEPVDYEWDLEETEPISDPDVLRIKVNLPELQGDYKTTKTKKPFGERLWAYANDQLGRVVAGERPELPKTENAEISLPLPDFVSRRFLNEDENR